MSQSIKSLQKEVAALKAKFCCGRSRFYDTFEDFPTIGSDNVIYVDKEAGSFYIWDGSEYVGVGGGDSLPYKVYTALLTQSGTSAPTAVILENTINLNPTFLYLGVGLFSLQYNENLPISKTAVSISNNVNIDSSEPSVIEILVITNSLTTSNECLIRSSTLAVNKNNIIKHTLIEIRLYL